MRPGPPPRMVAVIDRLTVPTWTAIVLWHLVWRRLTGGGPCVCHVVESSPAALAVARGCRVATGSVITPLSLRITELRDERGLSVRLRVAYHDLAEVQADILNEPAFRETVAGCDPASRVATYLAKSAVALGVPAPGSVWRALLLVQVGVWKRTMEAPRAAVTLFLRRGAWLNPIVRYAARHGVAVVTIPKEVRVASLGRRVRQSAIRWYRTLRGRPRAVDAAWLRAAAEADPRIMVPYFGHLDLDRPECYSDLFFLQQSTLAGRQIVLTCDLPRDPMDGPKWAQCAERGISIVALSPQGTSIPQIPVYPRHAGSARGIRLSPARTRGDAEGRWLREQLDEYARLRAYWTGLLDACHAKVYVSWYKYDASHCAIADAMQSLGGVTAIYQRAYESGASAETTVDADILFGFSTSVADLERLAHSRIPYFVATGYLGDHRFALLKGQAGRVRQELKRRGVERTIAYSDENSKDEAWWQSGHRIMREGYAFLLEKVMAEPWLGLLIKPKVPSTLKRRLGPLAALLARAEATGRCVVYHEGALHGAYPPSAAALGADVMVHGHLFAATAGLESSLTGVPTLLMDREGWAVSPLYRLGVGHVVFTEWERLWRACREHWSRPGGIPGFGDWSPMLDELDPFRDGRSAERMGTYLQWLIEGFAAGGRREAILAQAAERYAARWGKDKILQVHPGAAIGGMREAEAMEVPHEAVRHP